ncbi:hypothetical protein BOTNAR_0523g00060 [Botryotinia narcissicola]|uniref:Granulins domain-containing protein n=1 Tax=Botryotinia narcissicola TaxID=278944 RepID=A0A4Z1HJP6_9HELO|nr:hypothetical protein BOTNAR_0523g00060 [Botryotinia narcissicola]
MFSHLKHFFLSLIFYTAALGNQTPAFDDLVSSKFHFSTNNGTALAPLDGRSLLKSWLSPRVLTCKDPGYGLCPSNLGCCPRDENCCGSSFCVKPGESCCQGFTYEVGWNCCTYPYCYPDGGNCCSDGSYCTAGNICVNVRGSIKCCTDLTCSGHASGSVTISTPSATTASTVIPSSISIALEPSVTLTPIPVYEYYYYTITWYYCSYYYYYYTIHLDLSTSTSSTQIITTTTISVYETNSAAASSSFKQLSATLSFPTPAAATIPTQTPPSLPTQTERTTDPHTEVSIDTESLRGTGPASHSVSSTPSTTTRSVTSGSSSLSTATSTPVVVKVSGASGMRMNGHFWPVTDFMVFGASIVALWLL